MMEAIDNLRCVFDKKACCFEERLDYCEIREKDQQATFTKLNVECDGAKFGWVANEFYAGWKSVTENLSSKLQDSDCDGAFFLCDENDQSLWLVELKSTFDTRKVEDAFRQALFTYFKLQMAFSICNSVDVEACPLHFLVGCKPFKNENHESSVFARIQEEQLLGRKNFLSKVMYKLIENRQVTCRLRDLYLVLPDGIDAAVLNRIVIIHLFHPESFAEQEGTFVIS